MRIAAPAPGVAKTVSLPSFHRLVIVASAALSGAPGSARGASPPPPAEDEPGDVLTRVGELFRSGQDRFETSDFEEAIDLWTRAYEALPNSPEHQAVRAMLLANLARAHVQAHAIDGDVEHLRRADGLFADYLAMIDPQDTQTREVIDQERQQIAAILEQEDKAKDKEEEQQQQQQQQQREQAAQAERDAAAAAAVQPEPRGDAPAEPAPGSRDRRYRIAPYTRWERALVIGGGVTLAFAVGLIGATAAFVWLRTEEERDGQAGSRDPSTDVNRLRDFGENAVRFNRFSISTGTAAGVLSATGLGLVGGAAAHRRRRLKQQPVVLITPAGLALAVRGRF